jgi:hypothetical protein
MATNTSYTSAGQVIGRSAAKWSTAGDVRRSLEDSRARGLDFESAWSTATAGLTVGDVAPLTSTREPWRSAYCGQPHGCSPSFDLLASSRA